MENSIEKAYAEVDKILSYMEIRYVEKIPIKLRELFKKEKQQGYEPKIDPTISLTQQNLQRKTLALLAMLNLNYWCETEDEKQKLLKIYAENDKKREQELMEKYNPDNLFKNKEDNKTISNKHNMEIIEYREKSFIQNIIQKIQNLFKARKS